jgi:hypothetical protein
MVVDCQHPDASDVRLTGGGRWALLSGPGLRASHPFVI